MKKVIGVEIETEDSEIGCGPCSYVTIVEGKYYACEIYKVELDYEQKYKYERIFRCPACLKAECKAKEVEA